MVATVLQNGNQPPLEATVTSSDSPPSSTNRRTNENRRSNKPIMEKRRRARINNCLNELKTLILDAMKKDPARHSKLEKADILEMTVKHLQNLQTQQVAVSAVQDPSSVSKFRAGFLECTAEIGRYPGLELNTKRRLLQHLTNCLNQNSVPREQQPKQVQVILPNPVHQEQIAQNHPSGIYFGSNDVQLVPTRLVSSNGSTIALVVPSSSAQTNQNNPQVPLLVPLPPRANSASPSASSMSCSNQGSISPASSPELTTRSVYNLGPYNQKPIDLVMKKRVEEKPCWRPW